MSTSIQALRPLADQSKSENKPLSKILATIYSLFKIEWYTFNSKMEEISMKEKKSEKEAPKKENLREMIAYQEGAVVSRTLLKKKSGMLTLFAFDAGQGLSEHTSPYEAWVHIIDGKALVTISDTEYHLEEGDIIALPAGEPHALWAEEPFKMTLFMIREK